jgi:hypothetical protein
MKTAQADWDEQATKPTTAKASPTASAPAPTATLSGEAAAAAQINARVGEGLAEIKANADELGGEVDRPTFPTTEEVFPTDLPSLVALLKKRTREFESIADNKANRRTRGIARQSLEKLRQHFFRAQQGLPTPLTDLNEIRHAERQHLQGAAGARQRYLEKLAEAEQTLASTLFENPAHSNGETLSLPPRDAILLNPGIRESLAMLTTRAILIRKSETELFGALHPVERIQELKSELADVSDPAQARAIADEMARLRSPEAADIAALSRKPLITAGADFRTSFEIHRQKSVEALRELLELARAEETIFFSGFALPHQETALSKKYTSAIALIESIQPTVEALRHFSPAAAAMLAK